MAPSGFQERAVLYLPINSVCRFLDEQWPHKSELTSSQNFCVLTISQPTDQQKAKGS